MAISPEPPHIGLLLWRAEIQQGTVCYFGIWNPDFGWCSEDPVFRRMRMRSWRGSLKGEWFTILFISNLQHTLQVNQRGCGSLYAKLGVKMGINGGPVRYTIPTNSHVPSLLRSGDGYWQLEDSLSFSLSASDSVDVRVYCADGGPPKAEAGLIPADMMCPYQDPLCVRHTGTIQC
jgi:hypothetical protein